MSHIAYLSLGSNVGDRAESLRTAIAQLAALGDVTKISSIYETEPVGVTGQSWFLNCVVELRTNKDAPELMRALLEVERAMGRERKQVKGPRNIDLDLLLFDDTTVNTAELTVPHPAMHERRFVLEPLAEIAPGAFHPKLRKTAWKLLESIPRDYEVRRIHDQTM